MNLRTISLLAHPRIHVIELVDIGSDLGCPPNLAGTKDGIPCPAGRKAVEVKPI